MLSVCTQNTNNTPHPKKTIQIAYHLTNHPIAVHWDMDVAILQPLDDLYDAMIYPSTHPTGVAARQNIERQHPDESWPETIDAFLTRDITSAKPWEKVTAVQGGFLVARPDISVFDAYINFIMEGNYIGGRGEGKVGAGTTVDRPTNQVYGPGRLCLHSDRQDTSALSESCSGIPPPNPRWHRLSEEGPATRPQL